MSYKRFDIWLADLSPRFGTEPGKTRPVLIVQTDLLNQFHPSTLVCPLTTQIVKKARLLRVFLDSNEASLKMDSDIMIDQIRAIDNRRLVKKISHLPESYSSLIEEGLRVILDLEN